MFFDIVYCQVILKEQICGQLCRIAHSLFKVSALIDTQLNADAVSVAAFLPAAVSRMISHFIVRQMMPNLVIVYGVMPALLFFPAIFL